MNCLLPCVFILLDISAFYIKRKCIHPVDDDQYPVLAKLAKASFVKPITERNKTENSAAVKFWHAKGNFEIKYDVLTYNGKKVSLVITSF